MMQLGFNMAGTEEFFEGMINLSLDATARSDCFNYLEIGVAHGSTLLAVHARLADQSRKFRCVGVDTPDGVYFNRGSFKMRCPVLFDVVDKVTEGPRRPITISLEGSESFLAVNRTPFYFALIDGCHGKKCVMSDFIGVEPFVVDGGIVAFHDACEEDQGRSFQTHCREPINVRAALLGLGLLRNTRAHWKIVGEAHAAKDKDGNGFCFFQKV